MRKMLVIAAREYQAAVRTRSFLISLVILPVLMGGSFAVQLLLRDVHDTREKRFAIVDRTEGEHLYTLIHDAAQKRNEQDIHDATGKQIQPVFGILHEAPSANNEEAINQQRFELSERVRRGELFGFLEIGPKIFDDKVDLADPGAGLRYQSDSPTYHEFQAWAQLQIDQAVRAKRGAQLGISPAKLQQVLRPVPLVAKSLSRRDSRTGEIKDAVNDNPIVSFLAPTGLMVLMFMMVMIGATPLMQGVVEEKMQRIAEVLLGSVQPFELMMGKLLGMTGVSLTLAAIYLSGAYWAASHFHFAEYLSPALLAWFVVFQILSVMMYGSLFIAVGAACTDMRETQTMLWPVMLLATVPMFLLANVIQEPNSPFATGASFFPFATPTLMIVRLAVPPGPPWWQPLVGIVLVVATTVLCVYVAGRVFRVGILMQGKGARMGEVLRWIVRG